MMQFLKMMKHQVLFLKKLLKMDASLPQAFTFNDERQELDIVDKEPLKKQL